MTWKHSTWRRPDNWDELREAVFEFFGRACYWCGGYATQIDHVIPQAEGGPDTLDNLRPACAPCNHRRGSQAGGKKSARRWRREPETW